MFRSVFLFGLLCGALSAAPFGEELDTAFNNLKSAEEKKDIDLLKKSAGEVFQLTKATLATPKPEEIADVPAWKSATDYAKQVQSYGEYALHAAALRNSDNKIRTELYEMLEKERPDSEYLPKLYSLMLGVYSQAKPDKSFAFAQRIAAKASRNEDVQLVLAAGYFERKQYDRAATCATQAIALVSKGGEGKGDPDSRRGAVLSRAYWLAGMAYASQGKYPQADENLRVALPYLKAEDATKAGALFNLGVANYNMARLMHDKPRMMEALKYSEQSAKIAGPYQNNAQQNVWAMKGELQRWR